MAITISKKPAEIEDFTINWADRLQGMDTIISSAWSVWPTGLSLNSRPSTFTGSTTTVWLSGGSMNLNYLLTNTVTTGGGRTYQQQITCHIDC